MCLILSLDLVLNDADHHLRAGPFSDFPFGLGGAVATFAMVAGQFFADGALAEPDGLRDLVLGLSGLLHVGDHITVFRTEAVAFITHSQFVVNSDWMNPRLWQSNDYFLTILNRQILIKIKSPQNRQARMNARSYYIILILTLMLVIGVFITKSRPKDSRSQRESENRYSIEINDKSKESGTAIRSVEKSVTHENPFVRLKKSIDSDAMKYSKSRTSAAIDRVNAARLNGTEEGTYDGLMEAYWDEPEVFLGALKATAQGKELNYAISTYLSRAAKEASNQHFKNAYDTLNPGGARTSVAQNWVGTVLATKSIDEAIALISGFEMREERVSSALAVESFARKTGIQLNPEQQARLKQFKVNK